MENHDNTAQNGNPRGSEHWSGAEKRTRQRRENNIPVEALPHDERRVGDRRQSDRQRSVLQRCPDFAPWLKAKRIKAGLNQKQAAARAGLKPAQWSRLEKSLSGPSYEKVADIAKALGVDIVEAYRAASFVPPKTISYKGKAKIPDEQNN